MFSQNFDKIRDFAGFLVAFNNAAVDENKKFKILVELNVWPHLSASDLTLNKSSLKRQDPHFCFNYRIISFGTSQTLSTLLTPLQIRVVFSHREEIV